MPHPSHVVVGRRAKQRIDSHPSHTLYNAKRVLGRPTSDPAVTVLRNEVEFQIHDLEEGEVAFQVDDMLISPRQVGSYVVFHLIQITKAFLGHDNVKSAVLAVPAKFDTFQRQRTMEAFQQAGVKIARVLEEPAAAALAYGLHKKDGVEKILVYDFGGGTLDISILHVSEGYVEVMGSDGDDRLGGVDFDAAVANVLASRHEHILKDLALYPFDAEDLSLTCSQITIDLPLCSISSFHTLGEQLKISLSQSGEMAHAMCLALPPIEGNPQKRDICEKLVEQPLQLSLDDYNTAAKPLFDRSILPITRLMDDMTLQPSEIDEIVMVGGTTRMPQVRALVAEAFSDAVLNTHIDPDITVAYGAASVID
jgi:molecular chaperone DnaK (HSP70)